MNTDERMLDVLKQTLVKIEELNARLGHIEKNLTLSDGSKTYMDHYVQEIKGSIENNNIMG